MRYDANADNVKLQANVEITYKKDLSNRVNGLSLYISRTFKTC